MPTRIKLPQKVLDDIREGVKGWNLFVYGKRLIPDFEYKLVDYETIEFDCEILRKTFFTLLNNSTHLSFETSYDPLDNDDVSWKQIPSCMSIG